jgi:hypothetical protein
MAAAVKLTFPGLGLYEILGVDKAATAEQIKKAYFKKALQWVRGGCGWCGCGGKAHFDCHPAYNRCPHHTSAALAPTRAHHIAAPGQEL